MHCSFQVSQRFLSKHLKIDYIYISRSWSNHFTSNETEVSIQDALKNDLNSVRHSVTKAIFHKKKLFEMKQ